MRDDGSLAWPAAAAPLTCCVTRYISSHLQGHRRRLAILLFALGGNGGVRLANRRARVKVLTGSPREQRFSTEAPGSDCKWF